MATEVTVHYVVITTVYLISFSLLDAANLRQVETLYQKIFTNYNKMLFPLLDQAKTVQVNISMSLTNIQNFDELSGELATFAFFEIQWLEERINWEPSSFGGKTSLLVYPHDIWKPGLYPFNPAETMKELGNGSFAPLRLYYDGRVCWTPGDLFKTICSVDVTYYPFDIQNCSLQFGALGMHYSELQLNPSKDAIQLSWFINNSQWAITKTKVSTHLMEGCSVVSFWMQLQRKSTFFVIYILVPVIFLGLLNDFVFLLPANSGERCSCAITAFLAFVVFMTIVHENMPNSSDPISFLYYYLMFMTGYSTLIMMCIVFSIRIYSKEGSTPVPNSLQALIKFLRFEWCFRKHGKPVQPRNPSKTPPNSITSSRTKSGSSYDVESWDPNKTSDERNARPTYVTWTLVGKTFDGYVGILFCIYHVTSTFSFVYTLSMRLPNVIYY